jgi:hypothetical protein
MPCWRNAYMNAGMLLLSLAIVGCMPRVAIVAGETWSVTVLDRQSLKFVGTINSSSVSDLRDKLAHGSFSKLVIDSYGGDAEAGIDMGYLVFKYKLSLLVDGSCNSSCANYILPAARVTSGTDKTILIYHGDAQSSEKSNFLRISNDRTLSDRAEHFELTKMSNLIYKEVKYYNSLLPKMPHLFNLSALCLSKHQPDMRYWLPNKSELAVNGINMPAYSPDFGAKVFRGAYTTKMISLVSKYGC